MHAIVCHEHGDPDVMRYEEIPQPEPQPDEVLIEAEAIGEKGHGPAVVDAADGP